MPYIKPVLRSVWDKALTETKAEMEKHKAVNCGAVTPGEINYLVSSVLSQWMESLGGVSYSNVNTAIGALECIKLELYRRVAVPYEQEKISENGDIDGYKKEPHDISKY